MSERRLTENRISAFHEYLILEEKSGATVEKYLRDVRAFSGFADGQNVTTEVVMAYKPFLLEKGYANRSINSMLASINSFLAFQGWRECRVKSLKIQNPVYCAEEKELTKAVNHIAVQERCNGLRRFSDEHTDSLNAGSKQLP